MDPLVSVIVPTHNRKGYLPECLDSIQRQTYKPVELILVDDGSTDGTDSLIRNKYGGGLTYIQLEHTGLPAVTRNAGIQQSTGAYVAFCDSDDYWLPHKLETQIRRMLESGRNCSCCDAFLVGGEGTTYLHRYVFTYKDLTKELLWNNFLITSSVVLGRELLSGRRFSTRRSLRGYEDYAFWLSLVDELRVDFIARPLLYYRRHDSSLSSTVQHRDALKHLRILCTQPAYLNHPHLWVRKLLRYSYRLAT